MLLGLKMLNEKIGYPMITIPRLKPYKSFSKFLKNQVVLEIILFLVFIANNILFNGN